ncbi:hypothetical protein [Pantoea vagans]|uniref:hypothetical protein n=1 Tax=Pantoea vagans TaxID=470934 RepID=UPI00109383EE|nr:hypothetical protein [Pantoea vagans]QCA06674.1 hypothetical protein EGO56_21135 [Pantoea vagans]
MVETVVTVVRVKTAEMVVTALTLARVPTQMAEMEAQTEPMEGMVATEEAGIIHPAVMAVMAVEVIVVVTAAYNS